MVKKVKHLKQFFYKNDDGNGGADKEAIKKMKPDEVVILLHSPKKARLWGCVKPLRLVDLIKKNRWIYEVITKYPHKVYLDIDKKDSPENAGMPYLAKVKEILNVYFPRAEYAVSGSITENKTSFHLIINNYVIHNEEERNYVKMIMKHLRLTEDEGFDWTVYTKNRNMKAINQSKLDGRVQAIIETKIIKNI